MALFRYLACLYMGIAQIGFRQGNAIFSLLQHAGNRWRKHFRPQSIRDPLPA